MNGSNPFHRHQFNLIVKTSNIFSGPRQPDKNGDDSSPKYASVELTSLPSTKESDSTSEVSPSKSQTPNYFTEGPDKLLDDWQTLDFLESSAELVAFFDEHVKEGSVVLHPWQIEVAEDLCLKYKEASAKHPHKFSLCAANGSGKDAFVIAPFALWFILTKKRSRVIITSASGVQLTNQTEAYIKSLGDKINKWFIENHGTPILKINKRHIVCNLSGSEILLFATDQGEMAEGYHPLEPWSEMAIIVNEAKSVSPDIFKALKRCTGFNYWINVSTPGEPIGDFYNSFNSWKHVKRVTYFDCPHQSSEEFDEDRRTLGDHDPLFRSKWLALFTFVGGRYVIGQEALEKLKAKVKYDLIDEILEEKSRIGLDIALSGNGDETVISHWKGNKQKHEIALRNSDATVLCDNIEQHLIEDCKITKEDTQRGKAIIFGDDGGVGRAVIDILRRRGWNILRVLNQSAPKNKKFFRNRGAELWNKFNKFVLRGCIIPLNSEKLFSQLASRKYKESIAGIDKLCLQSKKEMIAEGLPSPDRADAAVLAFTDVGVEDLFNRVEQYEVKKNTTTTVSYQENMNNISDMLWKGETGKKEKRGHCHFSLNVLVGSKNTKLARILRSN